MGPDDGACAAALATLDLSPARLRRLMAGLGARRAWQCLLEGTHPDDPDASLRAAARALDPVAVHRRCVLLGLEVQVLGHPGYPACLAPDIEAPAVLFTSGDHLHADRSRRVAVVGTRSASAAGMQLAADMASALAADGVTVVSGLAAGIDSAALEAAVSQHPSAALAVLGSAHDTVATPAQRSLAARIASDGAVLSEVAPGTGGAKWRFAVRNRIMAAMAHVVVVVECHHSGGALHTVRAARRRSIPVAAVPGSLRAPASEGTNALLAGGAHCVRSADDVLRLLDGQPRLLSRRKEPPTSAKPTDTTSQRVLAVLEADPMHVDDVMARTGLSLGELSLRLDSLQTAGFTGGDNGWWWRKR